MKRFGDGRDWFFGKRFGMFAHWGLYALDGFHEQEMYKRQIPKPEYLKKMSRFDPAGFDPDAWLDFCERAGMEYLVVTSKHIDGFCMFDSALTEHKVTNTPFGKDVIGMVAEACARRNFRFGIYYCLVDGLHPNYPGAKRVYERWIPEPDDAPDAGRYLEYVRGQVRELCENYGKVSAFFWDGNVMGFDEPSINAMIRSLQPECVINDRGPSADGDYGTPERDYDAAKLSGVGRFETPTEACQAIGMDSWGWRADEDYHTSDYLIRSMDRMLAKGSNYLLNVGPDADGRIAPPYADVLSDIGRWYPRVREAFDGAESVTGFLKVPGMLLTKKGSTLYVHLNAPPIGTAVEIVPIGTMPARATLLNDGRPLEARLDMGAKDFNEKMGSLKVRGLPAKEFAGQVMILKLEFDQPPV